MHCPGDADTLLEVATPAAPELVATVAPAVGSSCPSSYYTR